MVSWSAPRKSRPLFKRSPAWPPCRSYPPAVVRVDPVPVAFVRPRAGAVLQEAALRASCLQQLARFKVPERIVMVEDFPIVESSNGAKVQKVRLREMAEALLCGEQDQANGISR